MIFIIIEVKVEGLFLLTIFSRDLRTPIFPNLTWKGEELRDPSSCSTTMTSIAPVKVAALISE